MTFLESAIQTAETKQKFEILEILNTLREVNSNANELEQCMATVEVLCTSLQQDFKVPIRYV